MGCVVVHLDLKIIFNIRLGLKFMIFVEIRQMHLQNGFLWAIL